MGTEIRAMPAVRALHSIAAKNRTVDGLQVE